MRYGILLCYRVRGKTPPLRALLDFAARKELSATSVLGSFLKQVVSGMVKIPEEILQAPQEQRKAIDGRALRLPDIVKMLQVITSS